jgi:hypothetical protein
MLGEQRLRQADLVGPEPLQRMRRPRRRRPAVPMGWSSYGHLDDPHLDGQHSRYSRFE